MNLIKNKEKELLRVKDFLDFKQKSINSFKKIKEEFDEHLYGINQNTNEIQHNYSRIYDLENKIEHLNEKFEKILNTMNDFSKNTTQNTFNEFKKIELNFREQEIFAYLYLQDKYVTIEEISNFLGLRKEIIEQFLYQLQKKGIKLVFRLMEVMMEKEFKDKHARNPIVTLNPEILSSINIS